VEVKDKGDGTLSAIPTYYLYKNGQLNALTQGSKPEFTNNYSARGTLPFVAQKVLIGGKLADHHFTFNLSRGDQQLATATTNDAGVARFPDLKYTQDDAGKTFQYTVSEQQGSDPNIVWDTHTETVTVKVTDNGDGTLSLSEKFSGTVGGTPLVWRNQMGPGNLRISKELTNDAQTQAHKDTEFPMKVRLVPPAGGKLADHYEGTITGNGGAPVSEQLPVTNGTITFQLKGGQSMLITGIAGGTSYQVVEEEE
jgi:pilin isopeptide linkage protein